MHESAVTRRTAPHQQPDLHDIRGLPMDSWASMIQAHFVPEVSGFMLQVAPRQLAHLHGITDSC